MPASAAAICFASAGAAFPSVGTSAEVAAERGVAVVYVNVPRCDEAEDDALPSRPARAEAAAEAPLTCPSAVRLPLAFAAARAPSAATSLATADRDAFGRQRVGMGRAARMRPAWCRIAVDWPAAEAALRAAVSTCGVAASPSVPPLLISMGAKVRPPSREK